MTETADSKIVLFPGMKFASPPQSIDDVREAVKANKISFTDDVASNLTNFIIIEMQNAGYDITSEDLDTVVSIHLIHESIRAAIFRLDGISHELHDIADSMYIEEAQEKLVDFETEME